MIAVLASASTCADVQAVAGGHRCILAVDQDELRRIAGDAHAVVLEAADLVTVLDVVQRLNRDHPLLPVILISERDSADVQPLASVSVEAVLFQHQIAARLPAALRSSNGTVFGLRALGEEYKRNEAIPAPLRDVLICVLTAVAPPLTVQHLARLLNSNPSTIRRHWRRGVNSHGIQRVKDLLDWVVLLKALSAKRLGLSWRCVAKGIGMHERTLQRLAVRLTGETLGSLRSSGPERLLDRFAETLEESFCSDLS